MKFDRKGFDSFRNDLTEAVKAVEETHQVKLEAGSIRFDDLGFTMGTTWKRSDIDANKIDFERNCALYGFQPEDYQREFSSRGIRYILSGFSRSSRKYACICKEVSTGNTVTYTADGVRNAFLMENLKNK